MDVLNIRYLDGLKRYWRRRKYQRLDDAIKTKRKLKIARFGDHQNNHKKELKIMKKVNKKLEFKIMTPGELVTKFHQAYVDAMVHLGGNKRIDHVKNEAKRVAKCQPIPMLSSSTNEMIDSRLALEIYSRVISTTRDQMQPALIPEVH
ncbi:hypothetical protein ACH5RR_030104 [Cinchona calisaya]|uniref:Uncharacterized protein n=1 Tax=Cinchona calisaya TaxID=153742 RepID=A0ABD2YTR1_9GENT